MDDLVINIYAPKHISGQFLTPQISENIIGYLIEEGFLDDIENNSNINVITHEA